MSLLRGLGASALEAAAGCMPGFSAAFGYVKGAGARACASLRAQLAPIDCGRLADPGGESP